MREKKIAASEKKYIQIITNALTSRPVKVPEQSILDPSLQHSLRCSKEW